MCVSINDMKIEGKNFYAVTLREWGMLCRSPEFDNMRIDGKIVTVGDYGDGTHPLKVIPLDSVAKERFQQICSASPRIEVPLNEGMQSALGR